MLMQKRQAEISRIDPMITGQPRSFQLTMKPCLMVKKYMLKLIDWNSQMNMCIWAQAFALTAAGFHVISLPAQASQSRENRMNRNCRRRGRTFQGYKEQVEVIENIESFLARNNMPKYSNIHEVKKCGGGGIRKRICLSCGKEFSSLGSGNRKCKNCSGHRFSEKERKRR